MELQNGEFTISTDKSRLQFDLIQSFLVNDSYWAQSRTPEQTRTGLVVVGNPNGPDSGHLKGELVLLVDGKDVMSSQGDMTSDHPLDDTDGHTLELRLSRELRGTMVIAYYLAVD